MPVGAAVRSALGPLERPAIRLYRDWFIDLAELAHDIAELGPFEQALEIGAGDGMLARQLVDAMPETSLLGIDISPRPGRMVAARSERLMFREAATSELLPEPDRFDLVVISDVLHHVPVAERAGLLRDAGALARRGGVVVVKDWDRNRGMAHRMAYFSDRYVSGDRDVCFMTRDELRALVEQNIPAGTVITEHRVPPRKNNVLIALRIG